MDIVEANKRLAQQDPEKVVAWAADAFGPGLVMSSSFGAESALLIHIATRVVPTMPVIVIDTGYLFPETHQFMKQLGDRFSLNLKVYSSPVTPQEMESAHGKLWEQGEEGLRQYHQIRKIEPMNRALRELRATALVSGVRADQTATRAALQTVELGSDGIYKIHPLLTWTRADIADYFKKHDLPYHPLVARGYGSIGDTHTTRPGQGRSGRQLGKKMECGLHLDENLHSLEKEVV